MFSKECFVTSGMTSFFLSPKVNISSIVMPCKRNKEPMQKKSLIRLQKKTWMIVFMLELFMKTGTNWIDLRLEKQSHFLDLTTNNFPDSFMSLHWSATREKLGFCLRLKRLLWILSCCEKTWSWSNKEWLTKQDKVNEADSAFIFLIILLISPSGQSSQVGQFCWGV